jgi:hypothetical protein
VSSLNYTEIILAVLDVLTTEFRFLSHAFVDADVDADVAEFLKVFPKRGTVIVLFHGAVRQLVDQDVEDLVNFYVQAHHDLSALVRVGSHGVGHPQLTSDGYVTRQHVEFLVVRLLEVLPQLLVPFVHLFQFLVLPGGEQDNDDRGD